MSSGCGAGLVLSFNESCSGICSVLSSFVITLLEEKKADRLSSLLIVRCNCGWSCLFALSLCIGIL